MVIKVHEIGSSGLELVERAAGEWLENAPELLGEGPDMRVQDGFTFRLRADMEARNVLLTGTVGYRVATRCSRCLKELARSVETHVAIRFRPASVVSSEDASGDGSDFETYTKDAIELDDYLREIVVMDLPQKVVCSEDCRGLCPECGTDLNTGECSCEKTWEDSQFAVLKGLKID